MYITVKIEKKETYNGLFIMAWRSVMPVMAISFGAGYYTAIV